MYIKVVVELDTKYILYIAVVVEAVAIIVELYEMRYFIYPQRGVVEMCIV